MKKFKIVFVLMSGPLVDNLEIECKAETKLKAYEAAKKEMEENIESKQSKAKFAIILVEEMEEK